MRLSSSVTAAGAAAGTGGGVGAGGATAGLGAATGFLAATRFLATTRFLAARTGFFAATRRLGAFAAFFFATTRDLAVFAAFFLAAGLLEPDFFFLAAMGISQRLRNSIAPGGSDKAQLVAGCWQVAVGRPSKADGLRAQGPHLSGHRRQRRYWRRYRPPSGRAGCAGRRHGAAGRPDRAAPQRDADRGRHHLSRRPCPPRPGGRHG